ncbi:HNH endonuclease [Herbiconiux daphne]|uniref:HNH endonuclease n=1 Tax=Herbiconiux daphne TaxID=2970914 RepID=A0ABT2H1I0_9MICO|nr:HNH endonuclease [Herbiconiux daphne]MCS5733791.1 HNH endonuclease [Herbiconiux daphne]
MSGWQDSNRLAELPPDWRSTRLRIMDRDRWRYAHIRTDTNRRCGLPARDVDHITPHAGGGTDDDNLQALCDWHPGRKSGAEGGRASGRARAAEKATAEPPHPGLLPVSTPASPLSEDPRPF